MKKLLFFALVAVSAMGTLACGSTTTTQSARGGLVRGAFSDVRVAAKDFEPVQIVFATTDGALATYNTLLGEAAKVGGHAIVNVVIEEIRVCEGKQSFMGSSSSCATVHYGSALAIRYTNALEVDKYLSVSDDSFMGRMQLEKSNSGFLGKFVSFGQGGE
ncbi:MAG: hypothetical protein FWC40_02420 [Proteobacteria bacterium]|nr:hypothetical protein [Pseudomonadota bacterium]